VEMLQMQHSTPYLCAYADNSVNYAPVNMPNDFSLKYAGWLAGWLSPAVSVLAFGSGESV